MKALSLFAICVLAKCFVLMGREIPLSWSAPVAYLWQDALVALVFGMVEFLSRRRPSISWTLMEQLSSTSPSMCR